MSVESRVKSQFAKVFQQRDWQLFKRMADVYLSRAAVLLERHVAYAPADLSLLVRNVQKRLFIGIGVELLLKGLYLRQGYAINLPLDDTALKFPFSFEAAQGLTLDGSRTVKFDTLIRSLTKVPCVGRLGASASGLLVAKVFRNKEGHVVVGRHRFEPQDYREVEVALVEVYRRGFDESLEVRFAMEAKDEPRWAIA